MTNNPRAVHHRPSQKRHYMLYALCVLLLGIMHCGSGMGGLLSPDLKKTLADMDAYAAFYPFSGDGDDAGPNEYDLTRSGGYFTSNRAAIANSAYGFNGTNDRVYVNNSSALNITSELTISAWIYRTDSWEMKVAGKMESAKGYLLSIDSSSQIFPEVYDSAATLYTFHAGTISLNTWTHLAMTWKTSGKFRAYINGVLAGEIDASTNDIGVEAGNFTVGIEPWLGFDEYPFKGSIDDLRVYAKEMNADEILWLYNLPAD